MNDQVTIDRLAQVLDEARLQRREIQPLARSTAGLDVEDGYRILRAGIELRRGRGEHVVGFKMGLTSRAKREQIRIDKPIWGMLTDRMRLPDGGTFAPATGIHARIEPEIAFVIGRPLAGVVTRDEALAACSAVHTALEILDSRFVGFKDFSLPDVVADNGSASQFVLSAETLSPSALPLDQIEMRLTVDGRVVHSARSSEISGHPVDSIVQLCSLIAPLGYALTPGLIVMAGAATPAIPLEAGHEIRLDADGMPSVGVRTT